MNSPLEMSYELLIFTAVVGAIFVFLGDRLKQNSSDEDFLSWGFNNSKLGLGLIMNGVFFVLGSLSVIVAKNDELSPLFK